MEKPKPFTHHRPKKRRFPLCLSSPHSGRHYPQSFIDESTLDLLTLRSSEDAYVDWLIDPLKAEGIDMLEAFYPRAYVDLNRARSELDPSIILDVPAGKPSQRVLSGLGVIPRVVSKGRAIRMGKISRNEAEARLVTAYDPYHSRLSSIMDDLKAQFGLAVLLDIHSMPSSSIEKNIDLIIGDCRGRSASSEYVNILERCFSEEGFLVENNYLFTGGYITSHYGQPQNQHYALQIEINRALYLHEDSLICKDRFDEVSARLCAALGRFVNVFEYRQNLAAE